MQPQQSKSNSVAFTGHRYVPYSAYPRITKNLKDIIKDLYTYDCIRNFYCGMAMGFDMLAAETVLEMKKHLPDITLSAVVPYRQQSERFSPKAKTRYEALLEKADNVVVLNEKYNDRCFLDRNDYMIDHGRLVVAYYDGMSRSGTSYTVKRAKACGLPVINIYCS